jgi:hypothetical protein
VKHISSGEDPRTPGGDKDSCLAPSGGAHFYPHFLLAGRGSNRFLY